MKKVNILLPFLLAITLILSSCQSVTGSAAPGENNTAGKPSSGDSDSVPDNLEEKINLNSTLGFDTNYVRLDDINPSAVTEIKLGFNINTYDYMIKETMDGFLCGQLVSTLPMVSVVTKDTKYIPEIRKLDKNGNILWKKEYDYKTYSGKLNNLLVYPDNSFLFSIRTYPYSNGYLFEKSLIIKCDKDGKELWRKEFDDYTGSLLHNLFLTGNDEIIAVGQWRTKAGKQDQNAAEDDIVVTKLDRDGNVLDQKGFGGSDFDTINTAEYDRELGIIINGRTQSSDGDFAINKDRSHADFAACIGESLNLKWVAHGNENESFIYDQLGLSEGSTYVLGSLNNGSGAPVTGFLVKLDKNGNRVWTKSQLYTGLWGRVLSILENGDIVIGAGGQNQGIIVILDKGGSEKKRFEDLKFAPNRITKTSDGGFIVTATMDIKTVPQPLYVSSIWFDTELVAVKYSSAYTIEWRKTYDAHKGTKDLDFALPLESGKIIIEKQD